MVRLVDFIGGWRALVITASFLAGAAAPALSFALGGDVIIRGEAGFSPGDVRWGKSDSYDTIAIPGFLPDGSAGYPELPVRSLSYLLPEGYRVSEIQITRLERMEDQERRRLLPARRSAMEKGIPRETAAVYEGSAEYPGQVVELGQMGRWQGERIAQVLYHPVGYGAAVGKVVLYPRVEFSLVLAPDEEGSAAIGRQRSSRWAAEGARLRVRGQVANAPVIEDGDRREEGTAAYTPFRPTDYPSLDGSLVEYVIVTTDELAPAFENLADWKTRSGVPAVVRTTSWIQENYLGGTDLGEKIRLFLREAYQYWGTVWVLLGGDSDVIPARYAHIDYYSAEGEDIPTDLYYAALDGSWDADGDGRFGEGYNAITGSPGDSVDLYPELFVGRAPVATPDEVEIFVEKTRDYRLNAIPEFQTTAFLAAEVLFPRNWEPGDPVFLNGCDIIDDLLPYIPPGWDKVILCQYPYDNMDSASVHEGLDAGYGLATLVTHGDAFKLSTGDGSYLRLDHLRGLGNDDQFSLYYFSGFSGHEFDLECLGEAALLNPSGGGVAAIGPSRLSFPHTRRFYLAEFYRVFFQTGMRSMGELSEVHRVPFQGVVGTDGAFRWTHLSTALLGDPELAVWKTMPDSLHFAHSGTMGPEDTTYTVTVADGAGSVAGVLMVMWSPATDGYARGHTDAGGEIVFHFPPSEPGEVLLTGTHPAYLTRSEVVTVTGSGALVHIEDVVIDDDDLGPSSGNGDGVFDAGECVELGITLKNDGDVTVSEVSASLGLGDGSRLVLDVLQDGARQPDRVFVGALGGNPAELPVTIGFGGDTLSPWGRPLYTASAAEDSGAYFWQDPAGWHLRFAAGSAPQAFAGSLATDGEVLAAVPSGMEAGDALTEGPALVTFGVTVDGEDLEDGIDLVLADSTSVTVLSADADYGDLAPGDTAIRFFLLESSSATSDQHQARCEVAVVGSCLREGGNWLEGVRIEVGAPRLGEEFHAVDDSTYGGNGNGEIEVGETVLLTAHVRNRGHGTALDVQGILRGITGVAVLDSTDVFGEVAAGALVSGTDGFRLTSASSDMLVELELRDSYGRSWSREVELEVPPAPTGLRAGMMLPQVETAVDLAWDISPAADLQGYNVYRSRVSGAGHSLVNAGLVELSAFYQDREVGPESTYFYRVAAVDSAGNQSLLSAEIAATVRPPNQGIWPRTTEGVLWSSPLAIDLGEDAEGDLEVLIGGEDARLYCWSALGNDMPGWPVPLADEVWSSPAAGNLDGDDAAEIVVGCSDGNLYAFNHDGTGLLSPGGVFASTGGKLRSTPTLVDLDRNLDLEILVGSFDGNLYAWHHDGTAYAGTAGVFAELGEIIAASPAAADLDGDGDPEVLVPTLEGRVWAFHHDGTGYGDSTGLLLEAGGEIWASPAVGDLDSDGVQDVVVGSWDGKIYRCRGDGSVPPGWPYQTGGEIWSSPALGDLDGGGELDVVVASSDGKIYAIDPQGNDLPGWPSAVADTVWSSPALADLTGDGAPEVIVAGFDGRVHALLADGEAAPGWPILLPESCWGSGPAAGDLDGDGDVEVLAACYDGRLYCWDVGQPWDPAPAASPWPFFCHDAYRTGWYDRPQLYGDVAGSETAFAPTAYSLAQNFPNPFNPRTVIRYGLTDEGPVALTIFDVAGRRVRRLVSCPRDAGTHEVVWEGMGDDGHAVASGIYFYRLEAGGETLVRKMILLR